MSDREQLVRLRIAARSGHLPCDLGNWAVGIIERVLLSADERRERRNELLRRAAARVDGSIWRQANELQEIIEHFRTYPGIARAGVMVRNSPAEFVQRAWQIDQSLPRRRQLLTILGASAIDRE